MLVGCTWQLLFKQRQIINPGQSSHGVTKDQGVSPDGASARLILRSPADSSPSLLSDHTVTGREHFTKDNLLIALKSLPTELLKREDVADLTGSRSVASVCANVCNRCNLETQGRTQAIQLDKSAWNTCPAKPAFVLFIF